MEVFVWHTILSGRNITLPPTTPMTLPQNSWPHTHINGAEALRFLMDQSLMVTNFG